MHSYDCGDMSELPPQLVGHGYGVISVKEEPEGVPPTSAGESVLPDDGCSMFKCRLQLERHRDSAIAVGEEVNQASAALTSEGWDGEDAVGLSVSHHPLTEVQTAAAVVKEEPTDVEWRCSDYKESSSSSAQERWDQGQQEEQGGSKGHDCRFCPFSSLFKSNVTVHERTHTGERPFTCDHCQMAFTTRRGLIAHASTFGDKVHFKCSACSRVFLEEDRLLEHEKIHAHEKPYKCDTCGRRFQSKDGVARHQDVHCLMATVKKKPPGKDCNVHPKKRKTHRYCCVIDCHNNEGTPNVRLYRFPSQPWYKERRQRWIAAVGRLNPDGSPWAPNDGSRICSAHFVNNEKSNTASHPAYCPTLFPQVYKKNSTIPQDQVSRFDRWYRRRTRKGCSTMALAKLPEETPTTSRNERGHLDDGGGMRASSLHLEGQWNGAFAVKREQDEGSAISISEAWHSGDTDYLSFSHGHLFASQTTSVLVKKEPEDVPPTSAGESVHFDGYGILSECPPQLEGYRDTGTVAVKEEPDESAFLWTDEGLCSGAPDGASSSLMHPSGLWMGDRRSTTEVPEEILPTPTGAGFPTKDIDGVSPSRLDLEGHWSDRAVKEEADEEPAASTAEGSDGGDGDNLFVSHWPKKEVQTVVVKEGKLSSQPLSAGLVARLRRSVSARSGTKPSPV
ncbi:hypothetical protein HPB47_005098 [Ixodes persulcatus]|uniref:Uncharacterized protein n=1 Tax=Ixodes persulcatus TaxID=34615 RepID=A0AC60PDV9_IXOPE|nr:hypothetical protein HPB47_005098 [Ixodes persulcatus]